MLNHFSGARLSDNAILMNSLMKIEKCPWPPTNNCPLVWIRSVPVTQTWIVAVSHPKMLQARHCHAPQCSATSASVTSTLLSPTSYLPGVVLTTTPEGATQLTWLTGSAWFGQESVKGSPNRTLTGDIMSPIFGATVQMNGWKTIIILEHLN